MPLRAPRRFPPCPPAGSNVLSAARVCDESGRPSCRRRSPRRRRQLGAPGTLACRSLSHYLDDDALAALPVEFRIKDLLPRAKVELARGDRQHYLMTHDRPLQMRVGVVLACLMMAVI